MNINDPKTLAAELLQLSVYLEMANQCLHKLTATAVAQAGFDSPDAGMVVVKADARYGVWDSGNVCVSVYKTYFASWDYSWIVNTGWAHAALVWRADGDTTSPNPRTAVVPSHLTLADGRGEGEVGACAMGWMTDPWIGNRLYAGPDPYILHIGLWDARICSWEAFAYNHAYPDERRHWWSYPDESTVLDCAAVPHAMTWRAA